jgi:hypothetical protein
VEANVSDPRDDRAQDDPRAVRACSASARQTSASTAAGDPIVLL